MKVCRDAEDILDKLEDEGKDGMLEDKEKHLRVDHIRVLYKWIHEKPIPPGTNRLELLAAWSSTKHDEPYMRTIGVYYTEADELKILELDKEEILFKDTLVWRKIRKLICSSVSALSRYSQEQLREYLDPVALAELQGKLIPPPAAGDTDDTSDINNGII